jgi:hypothetical protein
MSDAETVSEQVIWVDADGNVTQDKDKAVEGEIVEKLSDGTTRSTLFVIEDQADRSTIR